MSDSHQDYQEQDRRLEWDAVAGPEENTEVVRCPDCGQRVWRMSRDAHAEECTGESTGFDGTCKMCGEPYESYLDHLEECTALE